MPEDQETPTPETENTTTPESGVETVDDTKQQLAEMYLNFLDKQKGGILATGAGLGVNLNPLQKDAIAYLTTDAAKEKKDIFSTLGKNIKKKFIEKLSGGTKLEYDKASLSKMKALILQYKNDQAKLQELMTQIEAGTDPTIETTPPVETPATAGTEQKNQTVPQQEKIIPTYIETQNGKRKDVLTRLDKVVDYDKDVKDIKYTRGGRNSIKTGLDCSGLIIYTLHQAGFEAPGGGDSRAMFDKLDTKKLEMNNDGGFANLKGYESGDVIFRNTTNPDYDWKENKIPTTEKDGKKYRIHHMAFIKEVDPSTGKMVIVEANGSQGVVERELSYKEVKEANHKSDIYAGKINYDNLLAYTKPVGKANTNELA